ncbi:thioredoxin family protein [Calidifontibacillus oryziterrae]|uniref:thioredoxin family protein n=1 Tax=Calidifontibacillus oryziterrae TaxID=1191699 RepID=UPI0002EEB91C|nr:thioredoxin family protein [Calidifontibacillus oryziterrae]
MTETTKMVEIAKGRLAEIICDQEVQFVYFYTPLCGTCQLAGKMIEIVSETIRDIIFYKCNVNYTPVIARQYEIESVPCLTVWQGGKVIEKIYAFQSVTNIYDVIMKYKRKN